MQFVIKLAATTFLIGASVLIVGEARCQQHDPLAIFDGIWPSVNPPGPHFYFNKTSLNAREASLPFGQAQIRVSDGRDGSNFKVSGTAFDCYYFVSKISEKDMVWEWKSGSSPVCPKSARFLKDP